MKKQTHEITQLGTCSWFDAPHIEGWHGEAQCCNWRPWSPRLEESEHCETGIERYFREQEEAFYNQLRIASKELTAKLRDNMR
jgi:hypothetical protein